MSTKEQRNEPRWDLARRLAVVDSDSGGFLGYIINTGYQGMAMVGKIPVVPEQRIAIGIEIPSDAGKPDQLVAQVYSIWSRSLDDPGSYMTGLHIFLMSPVSELKYREIIGLLRRSETD
jgi:hypothetical protein